MTEQNQTALYLLGFADLRSLARQLKNRQPTEADQIMPGPFAIQQQLLAQLRIEYLRVGEILAWYKIIDRSEFASETAATNLSDLNWLTPRVLAHEAIVSKLNATFTLYPARFGCLFSNQERLKEFVQHHTHVLRQFFTTVDGRKEWGIKLIGDVDATSQSLAAQSLAAQSLAAQSPATASQSNQSVDVNQPRGVNYLKMKQLTRQLHGEALQQLEQLSQQALDELEVQFPTLVVRTLGMRNNPDRERVFASVALLMDETQSDDLHNWCNQWNARTNVALSLRMQVTGPWPPYSFCPSLEEPQQKQSA